jgi:hypothetical protein
MNADSLVFPMLAMVLLTFMVVVIVFRSRVRAVRAGLVPISFYALFQGAQEPEISAKPARHLANLFEAPVLFYAGCLAAMVTGATGTLVVALAWGYVAARLLHAWIHLGTNRIGARVRAFGLSWALLLALWIVVAVQVAFRQ